MKYTIFLNKELNVCVERTVGPNKHFLQLPTPTDKIFLGSDTGCLIKTKSLRPILSANEDQVDVIKPPVLHQVTNLNPPLPLQSNTAEHIQLLLKGMR